MKYDIETTATMLEQALATTLLAETKAKFTAAPPSSHQAPGDGAPRCPVEEATTAAAPQPAASSAGHAQPFPIEPAQKRVKGLLGRSSRPPSTARSGSG